jgi:hypothetical protein
MLYESHNVLWANFHIGKIDTASALQWQSLKIVRIPSYKMTLAFFNSFSNHASRVPIPLASSWTHSMHFSHSAFHKTSSLKFQPHLIFRIFNILPSSFYGLKDITGKLMWSVTEHVSFSSSWTSILLNVRIRYTIRKNNNFWQHCLMRYCDRLLIADRHWTWISSEWQVRLSCGIH